MKEYTKPAITDTFVDVKMAFPAVGLALVGGYVVGKAVKSVTNAVFENNVNSTMIAIPESVIAY